MVESKAKQLYINLPDREVGQKRPAPLEFAELIGILSSSLNVE